MGMTIDQLKDAIKKEQAYIDDECMYWGLDCKSCTYSPVCGDDLRLYKQLLQDAYCKKFNKQCSKCDYLSECHSDDACDERAAQACEAHQRHCEILQGHCECCKYLHYPCKFREKIRK